MHSGVKGKLANNDPAGKDARTIEKFQLRHRLQTVPPSIMEKRHADREQPPLFALDGYCNCFGEFLSRRIQSLPGLNTEQCVKRSRNRCALFLKKS